MCFSAIKTVGMRTMHTIFSTVFIVLFDHKVYR